MLLTSSGDDNVMKQVEAAVKATEQASNNSVDVPNGWELVTVAIKKAEVNTKLGITFSNIGGNEAHPVVIHLDESEAASLTNCQAQGKLMLGDVVISIEGGSNVLSMNWEHDCDEAETETKHMLKRSTSTSGYTLVNVTVERDGEEKILKVQKPDGAMLGLDILSNPNWKHPFVKAVNRSGPCYGIIATGDKIISIETATKHAKLATSFDGRANVATTFMQDLMGKVVLEVLRQKDADARSARVYDLQAELQDGSVKRSFAVATKLKKWKKHSEKAEQTKQMSSEI